ncbi:hypothetical protein DL96DRAFT_1623474 [Flagelloscypha sp. PMI_526]|nr:hypothetical protein DL96DRAFT_1623474 [Flagelloscypha sp. PMI_526]
MPTPERSLQSSHPIQPLELPPEIWRVIAGFLSDAETWRLRGLNSAFLATTLDTIYHRVEVIETGLFVHRMEQVSGEINKTKLAVKRPLMRTIRLSDPWISHRVREVHISHPGCPCLEKTAQPAPLTLSRQIKSFVQTYVSPPQDAIPSTVLAVLSELKHVRILDIDIGRTVMCPFIEQGWIMFSSNLTTLRLVVQRRVDLLAFTTLLTHYTPRCEHLDELALWLWLGKPRSQDEDEHALRSLAGLAPHTLHTLRLHGEEFNLTVFLERGRFPYLKTLGVSVGSNDKRCQKLQENALSSFLETPPVSLIHVNLGWSQSPGPIDMTYLTHLSLAHIILDKHILHQFQTNTRNLIQLELAMSASRPPRQTLTFPDVETIVKALSTSDNLRRLKLNTDVFNFEWLVTVAMYLPRLEQLWWSARAVARENIVNRLSFTTQDPTFSAHAETLQAWQLQYLWLDVPGDTTSARVMDKLAPFVKTLRRPKGHLQTAEFMNSMMKEWDFDISR